jgi:hypothetical protein
MPGQKKWALLVMRRNNLSKLLTTSGIFRQVGLQDRLRPQKMNIPAGHPERIFLRDSIISTPKRIPSG